jgi:hypothetical protein
MGNTIRGIKGLDNYSKTGVYNIAWSHTQDSKANPFLHSVRPLISQVVSFIIIRLIITIFLIKMF